MELAYSLIMIHICVSELPVVSGLNTNDEKDINFILLGFVHFELFRKSLKYYKIGNVHGRQF